METRAPYALIGLFVLAAVGAVFGFVFWLHNGGGLSERIVYRVRYENTVSGLLTGAAVLFNGIRVGEVTNLKLDSDNPQFVTATIAVDANTPVRTDTKAGLDFQGLTGVPVVTLQGGSKPLTTEQGRPQEPYLLVADPFAGQSMTNSARDTLRRLDTILSENSEPIRSMIGNLNTFSGALARNSDRLDGIVGGLERLMGGGSAKTPQVVYDLTAPAGLPNLAKDLHGQLSVTEPSGLIMFDTRKFLVRPSGSEEPSFVTAEWSDNVPRLLQAKIIQTFENAGLSLSVFKAADGVSADRQLAIDIRGFQISTSAEPKAEIELAARILASDGRITGAKTFRATAPVGEMKASSAATALDRAFGQCATELVEWAAKEQ